MSLDLDMDEIYQIFFEESAEGLDTMENGMLGLDLGDADTDVVNDIFRAAHSIKGGAATFGFVEISNFTHGVETLLDEVRSGQRQVSTEFVEIQLESVDCIRAMIEALEAKEAIDTSRGDEIAMQIKLMLGAGPELVAPPTPLPITPTAAGASKVVEDTRDAETQETWSIRFEPHGNVLETGNDPLNMLRELSHLGSLVTRVNDSSIPGISEISPGKCYLSWDMVLQTSAGRQEIEAVFDWVAGQCNLSIHCTSKPEEEPAPVLEVKSEEEKVEDHAPAESKSKTPQASVAPTPTAEKKTGSAGKGKATAKEAGSIRVGIDKVDTLLNLVGELVITQSMLKRSAEDYGAETAGKLRDGLMELERHTRELQESAMQIRMLPMSVSFSRFPRLVRDMCTKLDKKVELKFTGEHTELDKTVLEKMSDPLVHLVRNSLDHGIETPEVRLAAGKSETGTLTLSAFHEGGNIVIRVEDDGAGLNRDRILAKAIERGLVAEGEPIADDKIYQLIFQAGFSTADAVSDLSGRGVGMDVVRRNIKDLGGRIDINSEEGKGSSFSICLPLTLAILDGQLVRVGREIYIFSLLSIVETIQVDQNELNNIVGAGNVYRMRDNYIPVVRLREAFNLPPNQENHENELLVVVESDGNEVGIFVDDLLEQQQVVIKSLEENYKQVEGLAGATILGDGDVALILDVAGLIHSLKNANNTPLAVAESVA